MSRRRRARRRQRRPGERGARLSLVVRVLGLVVVVGFVVSRVLTDRFGWSQWVWWVPAVWWVVGAWGMLCVSEVFWWLGKRRGVRNQRGGVRVVLLVGCVGMLLNLVFGVWQWQNTIGGYGGGYGIHWTSVSENGRVRVMHWNLSAGEIDVDQTVEWVGESNIDVVLIANPRWDGQRAALLDQLGGVYGETGSVLRLARGVVASRFEILESSIVYVSASGRSGSREDAMRATGDFGWVARLRLDGGEAFGEFDVWFVDLPSEPTVHRTGSMGRVAELIGEKGWAVDPALIIGDFNTVGCSASLGVFDEFGGGRGFVDAFEERGAFGGSWKPRDLGGVRGWFGDRSSWLIDLSLVGNGWGVWGYELLVPDGSVWGERVSHRAQVVDLVRAR